MKLLESNKLSIIATFVGLLCTLLLVVYNQNLSQEEKIKSLNNRYKDSIGLINKYYFAEMKNSGKVLNLDSNLYDFQGKTYKSDSLFNKIVFCIPQEVCNVCYESLYENLSDYSKIVGADNLIVMVPKSRLREMFIELNVENKKIINRIYGIESFNFELYKKSFPFFFFLDKDYQAKSLFIHNLNSPELTIEYFNIIRERYINTKSNL